MSSDPAYALGIAIPAALIADPTVVGLVGAGRSDGPAVFGPHQPFDNVFPRITLESPQILQGSTGCANGSRCFVTIHVWAQGAGADLIASQISGAARDVFAAGLILDGHNVTSFGFDGAHHAGDPDPMIEHRVAVFHFNTQPMSGA